MIWAAVPNIAQLQDDHKLVSSPGDMANLLNNQFFSKLNVIPHIKIPTPCQVPSMMEDTKFSKKGVHKRLTQLNFYRH